MAIIITLTWIPGHQRRQVDEEVNKLAREGFSMSFKGPESYCGVEKFSIKIFLKYWIVKDSQKRRSTLLTC